MTGAKTVLHPKTACTLLLASATFFLSLVVARVVVEVVEAVAVVEVVVVLAFRRIKTRESRERRGFS